MSEKPTIKNIVKAYNLLVKNIEEEANADTSTRAYGGMVRAGKGALVESIAKTLVQIAWDNLMGKPERLSFDKQPIKVLIKKDYIEKLDNEEVKNYINQNIDKYFYRFRTDVHTYIDGKLAMGIECKAYTENAMLKRIMVDFTFLKEAYPDTKAVLLQLESQLGGDYSEIFKEIILGSYSTHTIMSYFDVDLLILTLLEGERKVDKPIHQSAYFKELDEKSVVNAVNIFEDILRPYL
ncbi:MAG: restriction endonuclease [Thermoproteota archaeon]